MMRNRRMLGIVLACLLFAGTASQAQTTIALDGKTDFRIVIPAGADQSTMAVALDFASILHQSTGALFPVYFDDFDRPSDHEFLIGADNARLKKLGLEHLTDGFGPGEYEIRTQGTYVIIAGASPRGSINGMYGFLQDHLGCRWLTPGCQYVPKHSTLTVADIKDRQNPAFCWRSLNSPMAWDPDWYVRNRFSESKEWCGGPRPSAIIQLRGDARTATMANSWNPHAFQDIPETVYKEHPEWYAEKDGKRPLLDNPVARGYCVTNEEFMKWLGDWTRQRIRRNPQIKFISITACDNDNACQCDKCKSSYASIGISGTYMTLANKVAEQVVKEFPDVQVLMLAYSHTFEPNPVKLNPNVRIVWCPISADWAHALDEGEVNGPGNRDYIGQLDKWMRNAANLGVWYYQDSFDCPMPRPTFAAMQRSLRLFRDRKVDQVTIEMAFNVSNKTVPDSDGDKTMPAYAVSPDYYSRQAAHGSWIFPYGFEHLRGYIEGRLLWNPDFDWKQGIGEFCDIYYGAAGPQVAEYAMTAEQLDSYDKSYSFKEFPGIHMNFCPAPRLKLSAIETSESLFDTAEEKVKLDPTLLRRTQMARMSVDLALIVTASGDHPLRQKAFDRFFALAEKIGIDSRIELTGGGGTIAELKKRLSDPAYKPQ